MLVKGLRQIHKQFTNICNYIIYDEKEKAIAVMGTVMCNYLGGCPGAAEVSE